MTVAPSYETFVVTCGGCHRTFDAFAVGWCRCMSREPAVTCSHCQACVHKEGPLAELDFWFHAPDELLRRRAREKQSRRKPSAVELTSAPRILVVDDDEEIRWIARHLILDMGYDCATASSPSEALAAVASERPAVILTDALMPEGDGRELCKTVKALYPELKVVVMTSLYTAQRYVSEATRVFGADDYLSKPIDFERLHAVLQRLAPVESKGIA